MVRSPQKQSPHIHGTLADRFWAKVNKTPDCWVWTAARLNTPWDYGILGRRDGGSQRAHCISWELHNGAIPEGLNVLHKCDNPPCVRPDHLFLGTFKDNTQDMISKGRRPVMGAKGKANRHAKVDDATVRKIRADYGPSGRRKPHGHRQADLAAIYGLHQATVSAIVRGATWKHVA